MTAYAIIGESEQVDLVTTGTCNSGRSTKGALLKSCAVRIFISYSIGTDTDCQPDADMRGQGAFLLRGCAVRL